MTRRIYIGVIFCVSAFASDPAAFDADRYLSHIKYLASPEMKGRASGSPELETAAQYIAAQFRADGLKPLGKSYLLPFEVTTSAKLGKSNHLDVTLAGDTQSLVSTRQFIPLNFSSSGKASGDVVFAGYGITAPEYNYDDYAGLDVKGRFVVVLAHEPQEFDEKSAFAGKVYTDHAQPYSKASNARNHGARGVLMVFDRVNHPDDHEELERFGNTDGPADAGIPFVQVEEEVVVPWLRAAGRDLLETEAAINADLKPRGIALPGVSVHESVDIVRAVKTVHNVAAYLPGETDQYVIVGAHYDHLGLGEQFSMAPSMAGTVHPGADDNASGTAGIIELARYFAARPKPKRGILFMTFAGEELGLLGSEYYANHPLLPLANAVTMLNLDMIGRVREGRLYIGGTATGTTLRADLDAATPNYDFRIDYSESGYGSSDHTSFNAKQVPVLFFFSGLHGDYHKPGDTWNKIDPQASIDVLRLVADVTTRLESDPARPQFVRVDDKPDPHSTAPPGSSSGGYGPYFGSIPDFDEPPTGVRFADVREGSPAALAGFRPGDILVSFGAKEIRNLYDFTYALRAQKVGDEVEVQALRGGEKITGKVKLAERR